VATISPRDFRSSWRPLRRCRCVDDSGLAVFNLMGRRCSGLEAVLCAFDLLELDDEEVQGALLPHPVHGVQSASR
jgi:hypothetical protein